MLKLIALPVILLFQAQHLTMTSIENVPGTDSLKVIVRIGYDQLLRDYQQTIIDDISLETLRGYDPFPPDILNFYINSKLRISSDKKNLPGKLLGTEREGDYITIRILYRVGKKIKSLDVRNTFLTGLYSDVENLAIVRINNYEKAVKFTRDHMEEMIQVKKP
jgi:hypothetical protein